MKTMTENADISAWYEWKNHYRSCSQCGYGRMQKFPGEKNFCEEGKILRRKFLLEMRYGMEMAASL